VDARLIDGIGSSGPGPRTLFVDPAGFGGTLVELVVLNDA
jgi:hypothetical protein